MKIHSIWIIFDKNDRRNTQWNVREVILHHFIIDINGRELEQLKEISIWEILSPFTHISEKTTAADVNDDGDDNTGDSNSDDDTKKIHI